MSKQQNRINDFETSNYIFTHVLFCRKVLELLIDLDTLNFSNNPQMLIASQSHCFIGASLLAIVSF